MQLGAFLFLFSFLVLSGSSPLRPADSEKTDGWMDIRQKTLMIKAQNERPIQSHRPRETEKKKRGGAYHNPGVRCFVVFDGSRGGGAH